MGFDKIKGSKRVNHRGLMTRADLEKGHPLPGQITHRTIFFRINIPLG
jgi:hypothetical protein